MSETLPATGNNQGNLEHKPKLPHEPGELADYFWKKEETEAGYSGYGELAEEALRAIDETRRFGKTDEELQVDIALIPGYSNGIYTSRHTNASEELFNLILLSHNLKPITDDMKDDSPYGRVLWQSAEPGTGINLIERRWADDTGDILTISAVSHVPEDLLYTKSQPVELPRFFTTGETESEVLDLYEELNAWGHQEAA